MKRLAARTRRALCAGLVALGAVALLPATGTADAARCGGATCVIVEGAGRYVAKVSVQPAQDGDFFGHFHLRGAGLDGDSALRHWRHGQFYTVALGRKVPQHTVICAEGWEHVEEKVQPHGRVCVDVRE
ncbi:hypothetical protein BLA24_05840 [Streptomyces cinnamoneus]|uniref:Secreted protein n=1 Tax=Streptomyces cinnamoneus TaxID=53446 RepID=A0A2G1XNJ0_STRCJ|nr:hypothetical protein [Streptomyces cinnamoneus]PHQ52783.1 hypothetical protein BLA24_05840 [Streptomyces cinnamoneus]PPT11885.1 hypothetical protein CYQ11_02315 [Streptomyces cinnamoneus]